MFTPDDPSLPRGTLPDIEGPTSDERRWTVEVRCARCDSGGFSIVLAVANDTSPATIDGLHGRRRKGDRMGAIDRKTGRNITAAGSLIIPEEDQLVLSLDEALRGSRVHFCTRGIDGVFMLRCPRCNAAPKARGERLHQAATEAVRQGHRSILLDHDGAISLVNGRAWKRPAKRVGA